MITKTFLSLLCTYYVTSFVSDRVVEINDFDLFSNISDISVSEDVSDKEWYRKRQFENDYTNNNDVGSSAWSSWALVRIFIYFLFFVNVGCLACCRVCKKRRANTETVAIIIAEQALPREDPPSVTGPVQEEETPVNCTAPPPSYNDVVVICPLPTYEEIMDKKENVSTQA